MNYSKTSDNAIVYDPFSVRPGTLCTIEITYSKKNTVAWNSSTIFYHIFHGFVTFQSLKITDEILDESKVTITQSGSDSIVEILPHSFGLVNVDVFYYQKSSSTEIARSAITETDSTYYKDYIEKDGKIVPETIVELPTLTDIYAIANVTVTPQLTNNGIEYINSIQANILNSGLLTYNDEKINVLRKGMQQVTVPGDSSIPYVRIEGKDKIVNIDNQEWQNGYSEARGLLAYEDKVLITTNKALCVFDIYNAFQTPELIDTNIIGYDLTYGLDDCILVAADTKIQKFRIRHNNILPVNSERRIYFREQDPKVNIL